MSPHGVGFVSYNALPGGHIRQVMRDMLVHELDGIIDPEQKLDATRSFLHAFKDAQADDDVVVSAIRAQAAAMLERPGNVLFHDELGDYFAPQSLSATIAEAEKNGLRYLSDGGRNRHLDGFMADEFAAFEDPEKLIVRQSQRDDYLSMRFFRQTLFVRQDQKPLRTLDPFRASPMWISTTMKRGEGREFKHGADVIELRDDGFADAMETISSGYPNRFPVSEHVQGDGPLTALLHMFSQWYANFHTTAPPFCLTVGNRPCTSPLVRGQIFMGFQTVCALNHQLLNIDQENIRALLVAADGTRTVSELENMDEIDIPADQVRDALQAAAMKSLMVA